MDAILGASGHAAKVLLNLMDADLIDSSGYSWLLNQNSAFRQQGGTLVLHSVPPWLCKFLV